MSPLRILMNSLLNAREGGNGQLLMKRVLLGTLILIVIKVIFFGLFPIYPDEVSYRLSTTRFLIDGHVRITSWASCTSTYALPLPFLMEIGAYLLSPLVHIVHYGFLRLIAVAFLLQAVLCLVLLARRFHLSALKGAGFTVPLLIVFLMSLQTFSPASTAVFMLRGEYLLFLAIPLFLLVAGKEKQPPAGRGAWYLLALLLFTASCYLHPKTLFFTPFFGFFIWLLFRPAAFVLRALLLGPLFLIAKQSLDASKQLVVCDEFPALAALNASFNINPIDLLKGNAEAIQQFLSNNAASGLLKIVRRFLFSVNYNVTANINYFPTVSDESGWSFIGYTLANAFIIACVLLLLAAAGYVAVKAIKLRTERATFCPERAVLELAGVGIVCVLLHILFNRARQFYDAGTWAYLLGLCCAFGLLALASISKRMKGAEGNKVSARVLALALFFLIGNLIETIVLAGVYFPPVVLRGWSGVGVPVVNVARKESLGVNRAEEYSRVNEFLPLCGIAENARLIIEDRIYPYVQNHPKPAQISWLWLAFDSKLDPQMPAEARYAALWEQTLAFMKKNDIAAVAGLCTNIGERIPPDLLTIEPGGRGLNNSFCCVKARD